MIVKVNISFDSRLELVLTSVRFISMGWRGHKFWYLRLLSGCEVQLCLRVLFGIKSVAQSTESYIEIQYLNEMQILEDVRSLDDLMEPQHLHQLPHKCFTHQNYIMLT